MTTNTKKIEVSIVMIEKIIINKNIDKEMEITMRNIVTKIINNTIINNKEIGCHNHNLTDKMITTNNKTARLRMAGSLMEDKIERKVLICWNKISKIHNTIISAIEDLISMKKMINIAREDIKNKKDM